MISRLDYTFKYSDDNLLIEISKDDQSRTVKLLYDDQSRVVAKTDSDFGTMHYFYGYRDKPRLISHIHRERSGFYLLHYDFDDSLMAFKDPENEYFFVKPDQSGTPQYVFDKEAKLLNSHLRSPYGILIQEQDDSVWMPLGYHGGIEDFLSGVVIIQGRPYDSHLGQWMTPDDKSIVQGWKITKQVKNSAELLMSVRL